MADTLPLDGSNPKSKGKDPANIMPLPSSQASAAICIDSQNDLTKNKKYPNVKSDKSNKISVNKESAAIALVASVTPSSVLKPTASTNSHQVNAFSSSSSSSTSFFLASPPFPLLSFKLKKKERINKANTIFNSPIREY